MCTHTKDQETPLPLQISYSEVDYSETALSPRIFLESTYQMWNIKKSTQQLLIKFCVRGQGLGTTIEKAVQSLRVEMNM